MSRRPVPALTIVLEAIRSARSQPVATVAAVVMIAGMCVTVLQTTGRAVGAQQDILATIDSAGTRSIVIQADPDAGLTTEVLARIELIHGVAWSGAFGAAADSWNVATEGGLKVPVRTVWTSDPAQLGVVTSGSQLGVWGTDTALRKLGMVDNAGGVLDTQGNSHAVLGVKPLYEPLTFLDPVLLEYESSTRPGAVSLVVVVADAPELVAPVAAAVRSVLPVEDPNQVSVSTSEEVAALRGMVDGTLNEYGHGAVVTSFAATGVLVAAVLHGIVMFRRRDFGRRRALGASQWFIVLMLLTQMAMLGLVGGAFGCAVSLVSLAASGDPLPTWQFVLAVPILATAVGTLAAIAPAVGAARRDPLHELRVP